jgi:hypothetical protein
MGLSHPQLRRLVDVRAVRSIAAVQVGDGPGQREYRLVA